MLPKPSLNAAFRCLAEYPDESAAICRAIAEGKLDGEKSLKRICTSAGISQGRSYIAERVLISGQKLGLFSQCSSTFWIVDSEFDFSSLASLLEGAAMYVREVFQPADKIGVVLTLPPSPSNIQVALEHMGFRSAFIENTQEIFSNLAISAQHRFLVMTPFLDFDGGKKLLELFRQVAPDVKKQLIVRCANGVATQVLSDIDFELKSLGVAVTNYWLLKDKPGTYETFHAKVILVDSSRCYVGSANMTQASLTVSMELGLLVEGEAVKKIELICNSILQMANNNYEYI